MVKDISETRSLIVKSIAVHPIQLYRYGRDSVRGDLPKDKADP